MMLRKTAVFFACVLFINTTMLGQNEEKVKEGFTYIPLPVFQYNSDQGTIYGIAAMAYDFDGGQYYPNTKRDITLNAMYSTKSATDIGFMYDDKHLFNKFRLIAKTSYKNDLCYQFYGFNGYQANFTDSLPQAHYYYNNKNALVKVDVLRSLKHGFNLKIGYRFQYVNSEYAKLDKINKGQDNSDKFYGETLFEKYHRWGIIADNEIGANYISSLNLGVRYDTRDQEAAPQKGILAEIDVELAPDFIGNSHSFYKYEFNWRQYNTLVKDHLVFAYRVNYMGTIGKNIPFYAMPANNTVRGMMMNRIQALDIATANAELRWMSNNKVIFNQNFAFGLNVFYDMAQATRFYKTAFNGLEEDRESYNYYIKSGSKEQLHQAIGAGFQFMVNRNFIARIEFGHALDKQDNFANSSYFTFGYLF